MFRGALGCLATNSSTATTKAAIDVFMSLAPRPKSLPPWCVGENGGLVHWSNGPVGTTSVWPANTNVLIALDADSTATLALFAHKLRTLNEAGPLSIHSNVKPNGASRAAITSMQPASSGVFDCAAISCSVRRMVSSADEPSLGARALSGGSTAHVVASVGVCFVIVSHPTQFQ